MSLSAFSKHIVWLPFARAPWKALQVITDEVDLRVAESGNRPAPTGGSIATVGILTESYGYPTNVDEPSLGIQVGILSQQLSNLRFLFVQKEFLRFAQSILYESPRSCV